MRKIENRKQKKGQAAVADGRSRLTDLEPIQNCVGVSMSCPLPTKASNQAQNVTLGYTSR